MNNSNVIEKFKTAIRDNDSLTFDSILSSSPNKTILGEGLVAAAYNGKIGIIERLLEAGADINYQSSSLNRTPLFSAVFNFRPNTTLYLLQHGASKTIVDKMNRTPEELAIDFLEHHQNDDLTDPLKTIIEYLQTDDLSSLPQISDLSDETFSNNNNNTDDNSNNDTDDNSNNNNIINYEKYKDKTFIEILVILYEEIKDQNLQEVEEIVDTIEEKYGNNIFKDITKWAKLTPIQYAVKYAYSNRVAKNVSLSHNDLRNIVELFDDKGVDIDAQDIEGNTAVHMAVLNNDLHSVIMLSELAAELNIPNSLGFTPYNLALRNNNKLIMDFLRPRIDSTEHPEGSRAHTYAERKWLGVKRSIRKSVYMFLGHGSENVCFQERDILPEGYTLITFSKCGKVAYSDDVIELVQILNELGKIKGNQLKLAKGDMGLLKQIKTLRKAHDQFRIYKAGDKIPNLLFYPISNQYNDEQEYLNKSGVYKINIERFNPNTFIKSTSDDYNEVRWNFKTGKEAHKVYKPAFKGSSYPTEKSIVYAAKNNIKSSDLIQTLYTESALEIMKRLGPGTYFFIACRASVCSFETDFNSSFSTPAKNNLRKNIKLTRRLSNRQQKTYFPNNYGTNNNIMNEVKPMNYYKKLRKTRRKLDIRH